MPDETPPLMSHIQYAEVLIGKAMTLNGKTKSSRRAKDTLLLTALCELQAAIINTANHPL